MIGAYPSSADQLQKIYKNKGGLYSMKKVLDVRTKGWSNDNIDKLKQKLIKQGIKYQVQIELKDRTTKWLYARDPKDVQPYCEQIGATILKIEVFS